MSEKLSLDIKRPRGTRDFMPKETLLRRNVERTIRESFESFGFQEIQTPIFEQLTLFEVRSGDKFREDIYRFYSPTKDEYEGEKVEYCLRPELTAPTCRFFVNDDLGAGTKPIKSYYIGPCFRYDKPAPGRYREFYQAGIELFGADTPRSDAEVIEVAAYTIKKLGIPNFTIQINDMTILRTFLQGLNLDKEQQARVVGIIDNTGSDIAKLRLGAIEGDEQYFIAKFEQDLQEFVSKEVISLLKELIFLKGGLDVLSEVKKLFTSYPDVIKEIDATNLGYVYKVLSAYGYTSILIDFSIARGLDYYTGLVFEIDVVELGSQKQVCGGGRYNNLVKEYGGHETPATGFGIGFDRLVQCVELFKTPLLPTEKQLVRSDVLLKMMVDDVETEVEILSTLRENGIRVEVDLMNKSMKKLFSFANKLNIPFVLILGKKELEEKKITIKDMKNETQESIDLNSKEILKYLKFRIL
jgi:histidyl-tRNA synthetase